MREMSDLRKQLFRVLSRIGLIEEDEVAEKVSVSKIVIQPNSDLDKALRKALCCGWIDQVARRSNRKSSNSMLEMQKSEAKIWTRCREAQSVAIQAGV